MVKFHYWEFTDMQSHGYSSTSIIFLTRDEIKNIIEIGFSALEVGDAIRAEGIFDNLKFFLPLEVAVYFGLSLSFLGQRRYKEAVALLEEAVKIPNIDVDPLRLLLALSRKNIGDVYESKQQMKMLSISASDAAIQNIAKTFSGLD